MKSARSMPPDGASAVDGGISDGVRYRIRLPGFIREDQEVGLGDIIGRATSLAGFVPCSECTRRAQSMNQWLMFSSRQRRGE